MQFPSIIFFGCLLILRQASLFAQGLDPDKVRDEISNKVFASMNKKIFQIEQKLNKQTEKYLAKFQKNENNLRKKLWKKDSNLTKQLFDGSKDQYHKVKNLSSTLNKYGAVYCGHLDSLFTVLKLLKSENLSNLASQVQLKKALAYCESLQGKVYQTDQIKKFLSQRNRILKEQFEKLGMVKELKTFQKQVYYYQAKINEYKRMFETSSGMGGAIISLALKVPGFKKFFSQHSMLANLFPNVETVASFSPVPVMGLQSRAMVNQYLGTSFGGTVNYNQAFLRNIQSAREHVDEWRQKLILSVNRSYSNSDDLEQPDFRPNNQKTKSFFQRLEYGTNLQTAHANFWFPITTDLGFSLGYKLNDRNIIGIGASYKIGWGKDLQHVDFSSQGLGLRSFLDIKIKRTYFFSESD